MRLLVLAATAALVGAFGQAERAETSVIVTTYRVLEPSRLVLNVDSCNRAPRVAQLRETGQEVEARVVAEPPDPAGEPDCSDGVEVDLEAPLGERPVVDATTGQPVHRENGG